MAERIRFRGKPCPRAGTRLLSAIADDLDTAVGRASETDPGMVPYRVVSLAPERAQELEGRLRALIDEFEGESTTAAGTRRYGFLGAFVPLEAEGATDGGS